MASVYSPGADGAGKVEAVAVARDRLQQETNFANGAPRRLAALDYIICGIWPTGKHITQLSSGGGGGRPVKSRRRV